MTRWVTSGEVQSGEERRGCTVGSLWLLAGLNDREGTDAANRESW